MINTGLVSITFRKLSVEEIVKIVVKAGLSHIEWGGDIHVPHGDLTKAREVSKITQQSGLNVAAYGSYYRLGTDMVFEEVLETAIELKAPTIRVWAGNRGSVDADEKWWNKIVEETYTIAELAQKSNINIDFEYHGGTLTDTLESTLSLLEKTKTENVGTYWQPPVSMEDAERIEGLKKVLPWLKNIHVFYWEGIDRHPLAKGKDNWIKYLDIVAKNNINSIAMMEFVKDDSIEQFYEDAAVLKSIVDIVNA